MSLWEVAALCGLGLVGLLLLGVVAYVLTKVFLDLRYEHAKRMVDLQHALFEEDSLHLRARPGSNPSRPGRSRE